MVINSKRANNRSQKGGGKGSDREIVWASGPKQPEEYSPRFPGDRGEPANYLNTDDEVKFMKAAG